MNHTNTTTQQQTTNRSAAAATLRFMRHSRAVLPWLTALTILSLSLGIFLVIGSPDDYQQQATVKIMYLHVPFAWLAMLCYTLMSLAALCSLAWHSYLAAIALKMAAPIGAIFTALALITGSLWGRPTWGSWWEWDARLTSVLILLFVYLAIIALSHAFHEQAKAAKATAIMTLVGFINVPIIKFSVHWWNTLHQPTSLFRRHGPAIDPSMLWPLLSMATGFVLLFFLFHLLAMRNEILRHEIDQMQRILAHKNAQQFSAQQFNSQLR